MRELQAVVVVLALAGACLAQDSTILGVQGRRAAGRAGAGTAATVTLVSEGGFRWAKTERIVIGEAAGKYSITVERTSYEDKKQGPVTRPLSRAEHDALVAVLKAKGAMKLRSDVSAKGRATDLPEYDLSVTLDGKTNRFQVYGPQILGEGSAHLAVVDAVDLLAEMASPAPLLE
jgi:hypothetical protein